MDDETVRRLTVSKIKIPAGKLISLPPCTIMLKPWVLSRSKHYVLQNRLHPYKIMRQVQIGIQGNGDDPQEEGMLG